MHDIVNVLQFPAESVSLPVPIPFIHLWLLGYCSETLFNLPMLKDLSFVGEPQCSFHSQSTVLTNMGDNVTILVCKIDKLKN